MEASTNSAQGAATTLCPMAPDTSSLTLKQACTRAPGWFPSDDRRRRLKILQNLWALSPAFKCRKAGYSMYWYTRNVPFECMPCMLMNHQEKQLGHSAYQILGIKVRQVELTLWRQLPARRAIGGTKPHQFRPTTHLKNSSVGIAKPIFSRSLGPSCSSSNRAESGRRHWRSGQCASAPFAPERQGIKGTSGAVMFGIQQVMIQRPSGSSFCVAGTLLKQIQFPTSSMNHVDFSHCTRPPAIQCAPSEQKVPRNLPAQHLAAAAILWNWEWGAPQRLSSVGVVHRFSHWNSNCQTIPKKTEGWTSFGKHLFILS